MSPLRFKSVLFGFCAATALSVAVTGTGKSSPAPDSTGVRLALLQHPDTRMKRDFAADAPAPEAVATIPHAPAPNITVPQLPDVTVSLPEKPTKEAKAAEPSKTEQPAELAHPNQPDTTTEHKEAASSSSQKAGSVISGNPAPAVATSPLPETAQPTKKHPVEQALLKQPSARMERNTVADGETPEAAAVMPNSNDSEVTAPPQPGASASLPEAGQSVEQAEPSPSIIAPDTSVAETAAQPVIIETPPLPAPAEIKFTDDDKLGNALATHLADHGSGKGLRLNPRLPKETRQAIASFYENASYRPLWIKNGDWTPAALALREQLTRAADDALDPADYPVPALAGGSDPEALAQAELSLSAAVILYAGDARGGRINPSRLSKNITPELELPKAADVLINLSSSSDAAKTLESYNPQHSGYLALKRKLAEIRQSVPAHGTQEVPRGPTLKVGMKDERVPLVRARFGLDPSKEDQNTYDDTIAAAIADFQKDQGLKASGDLNNQTVLALAQNANNPRRMEADIIANMERWRWLPSALGERYIQVNVPEYELRIVADGSVVREAKVIVGKAASPTPIFSGAMQTVVVNPYWTIPPSIMKNEILPGLARDPSYAAKRGYQVTRMRNGNIMVRQPPGDRNALGYIKFLFPNQHAVYLHDTPNRGLFSAEKRAFSHGCVRVDQPFQFAEEVLGRDSWPTQKVRSLIGKGEQNIKLETPIPVHLTYFTLSIDKDGEIRRFDDIYGFNKQVRDALGLKS